MLFRGSVMSVLLLGTMLVAPLQNLYATELPQAGDLVTVTGEKTVYSIGWDGKRYPFPNEKVYRTWFRDFSRIKEVSVGVIGGYALGKPVLYRPGTRLIKIQSDPKVYAVSPFGMLHPIKTEELAIQLYGNNWAKRVDDVDVVWFDQYRIGDEIGFGYQHPTGTVYRLLSAPEEIHYVEAAKKRILPSKDVLKVDLFSEGYFDPQYIVDVADATINSSAFAGVPMTVNDALQYADPTQTFYFEVSSLAHDQHLIYQQYNDLYFGLTNFDGALLLAEQYGVEEQGTFLKWAREDDARYADATEEEKNEALARSKQYRIPNSKLGKPIGSFLPAELLNRYGFGDQDQYVIRYMSFEGNYVYVSFVQVNGLWKVRTVNMIAEDGSAGRFGVDT